MLQLKICDCQESESVLESNMAELKSELEKSNVSFKKFSTSSRLLEDNFGGQRTSIQDLAIIEMHQQLQLEVKLFLYNLQPVEVCFLKLKFRMLPKILKNLQVKS